MFYYRTCDNISSIYRITSVSSEVAPFHIIHIRLLVTSAPYFLSWKANGYRAQYSIPLQITIIRTLLYKSAIISEVSWCCNNHTSLTKLPSANSKLTGHISGFSNKESIRSNIQVVNLILEWGFLLRSLILFTYQIASYQNKGSLFVVARHARGFIWPR